MERYEDEDLVDLNKVQQFLLDGFFRWAKGRRSRSERSFAIFLGVNPNSWSNWIRRGSVPDMLACIKLAEYYGPEIFDVCDYPRVAIITDDRMAIIHDAWPEMSNDEREALVREVERSAAARAAKPGRPQRRGAFTGKAS